MPRYRAFIQHGKGWMYSAGSFSASDDHIAIEIVKDWLSVRLKNWNQQKQLKQRRAPKPHMILYREVTDIHEA